MTNLSLTQEQAASIRSRHDALTAWLRTNKRNSYRPEELPPEINPPTNDELSALELFEFMRDRPDRYFLYIRPDLPNPSPPSKLYGTIGKATTWTGQYLGTVQFGRAFRDNFGGTRVPITVRAITGDKYHGAYFASSGDYARIYRAKRKAKP